MMRVAPMLICIALPAAAGHEMTGRDLSEGEALYASHCASCHGAQLQGQPDWQVPGADGVLPAPPHDVTGHTWHHDDALLFEYTSAGGQQALAARGIAGFKSGMPAFGEVLSVAQIWTILAYIRSTWPEEIQSAQSSLTPAHH